MNPPPSLKPMGVSLMPRKRPARPCGARRTNGLPCGCFAIVGGAVCRAHGGAAPQVKAAARQRVAMEGLRRGLEVSIRRHQERVRECRQRRAGVVAELYGIPPERVTPLMIAACSVLDDRPDLMYPDPEFKFDNRYGPRLVRG